MRVDWPFGDLQPFSYDLIMAERMVPDGRKLDLFSREAREGWDAFGNETEKFESVRV